MEPPAILVLPFLLLGVTFIADTTLAPQSALRNYAIPWTIFVLSATVVIYTYLVIGPLLKSILNVMAWILKN